METAPPSPLSPPRVADFIERDLEGLVQRWAQVVGGLASARGLRPQELLNNTPELLRALAALSREGEGEGEHGDSLQRLERLRDGHLSHRLRLGYNLEEVTSEYAALGRLVAALWERLPPAQQPAPEDTARLFAALQHSMDAASAFFSGYSVEDRQREKRALRQLDALAPERLGRSDAPTLLQVRLAPLVEVICEALAQDGAQLLLADEAGEQLFSAAAAGRCAQAGGPASLEPFSPRGVLAQVAAAEEPLHLPDAALAPAEMTQGLCSGGLRSLLGLRLWPHGKLLGVLYVGSSTVRAYEPQERRYLEMLVEYLAGIIDRALLFEKLHQARYLHAQGEAHWRQLVQSMQDYAALYMLDAQGRISTWNAGAERFAGYRAEEVLGQPLPLFYPEGQKAEAAEHLRRAAEAGRFGAEGWRVRRKAPSPFWAETTLIANRDAAGELRGFTQITRDLTERREAEQERVRLLERERRRGEQLQGLAQTALAIHGAGSVEAALQVITEQARALIGAHQAVTSLSAQQGSVQAIRAVSLSDKYAAWRDYTEPTDGSGIYSLVVEEGRSMRLTQEQLERHPRWRGFGAHASRHPPLRGWLAVPLVGHGGRPFGVVQLSDREEGEFSEEDEAILVQLAQLASVAVENLQLYDALRESEDRLRLSLAAAQLGTWDYDATTGALHWDARARQIAGLPPEDAVTWDTFRASVHPEDLERVEELARRALAGEKGGLYEAEYRTVAPRTGRERWVSAHGRAHFDAAGRPVRFLGTALDITEHKRWDQEAARRLQFEQQLIGIVSHDLRNPLNAIMLSNAALLRRTDLDEHTRTGLLRTRSAADRMVRMVRDLLDFTQARLRGALPLQRRPLDLHALARQVVDEVRLAHPERALQLQCEGDGAAEGDPDRLAQALTNLVTNALQYSPEDTPVRVRSEVSADALVLSVHNQGTPIAPELLPRLFEPLERGEEAAGAGRRSIGLGLYIVQHIVQAHGGRIEVRSTAAEGTTFTLRLPRSAT
ncbi:MAG TPA: PAS domain S-box protein, partial [Aggregicoccus sp.]|nr:PAS domain S-box protein [Aggregicoccus sp.]